MGDRPELCDVYHGDAVGCVFLKATVRMKFLVGIELACIMRGQVDLHCKKEGNIIEKFEKDNLQNQSRSKNNYRKLTCLFAKTSYVSLT
jgi:hypothetical protein